MSETDKSRTELMLQAPLGSLGRSALEADDIDSEEAVDRNTLSTRHGYQTGLEPFNDTPDGTRTRVNVGGVN